MRGLPKDVLANVPKAIMPLLQAKTCGSVLYQRFRSEVIHGGKVHIDEQKFFSEKLPYWKPLFSEYYGTFLLVEFPAAFLHQLLKDCMRTYEHHLRAKGKVSPDIHFEMFPDDVFERLEWLDQELVSGGREIRLSISRR